MIEIYVAAKSISISDKTVKKGYPSRSKLKELKELNKNLDEGDKVVLVNDKKEELAHGTVTSVIEEDRMIIHGMNILQGNLKTHVISVEEEFKGHPLVYTGAGIKTLEDAEGSFIGWPIASLRAQVEDISGEGVAWLLYKKEHVLSLSNVLDDLCHIKALLSLNLK